MALRHFSTLVMATVLLAGCASDNDWPSLKGAAPPPPAESGTVDDTAAETQLATTDQLTALETRRMATAARIDVHRQDYVRDRQALDDLSQVVESWRNRPPQPDSPAWFDAQIQASRIISALDSLDHLQDAMARDTLSLSQVLADLSGLRGDSDEAQQDMGRLHQSVLTDLASLGAIAAAADSDVTRYDTYRQAADHLLGTATGSLGEPTAAEAPEPVDDQPIRPGETPLATLRFDNPDLDIAVPLDRLLDQALARYPDLALDVVALRPVGFTARSRLDDVTALLAARGLSGNRARVETFIREDVSAEEIRLYPR